MKTSLTEQISTLRTELERIGETLSLDYHARHAEMAALYGAYQSWAAKALAPSLNQFVQKQATPDVGSKASLAKTLNLQNRELGLAFACPITGKPSCLSADCGPRSTTGRFRFVSSNSEGRRLRLWTRQDLPELQLVPDLRDWRLAKSRGSIDDHPRGIQR